MSDVTWEFEAADPEVGFLSDSITHTCDANLDDPKDAEVSGTTFWDSPDGTLVNEQTVLACPACGATTTMVSQWPAWMFKEDE